MPRDLWYIEKRAYDLTPWLDKHPGGFQALRHAQGTDCTELFHSYHLRRAPPAALLKRFEVDVDATDPAHVQGMGGSHFTFAEGEFYRTVQTRVRQYFRSQKRKSGASPFAQVASFFMIATAIGLLVPSYLFGSIACAILLAFVKTLAAIGPGHSMSHFSLFPRGRWNLLAFRLFAPFLVSNPAIWSAAHIQSHHVHTLTGRDLQDNYPLKRIQPAHPHLPMHRYQHVYIWLVYLLGLPLWSLQDFVFSTISLFTPKFAPVKFSFAQRVENTLVIGSNLFCSVILPFVFLEWRRALLVCLLVNVPSSFCLVIQIAVNHEVPETMNKVVPGEAIDWGKHQVLTSHNFAVDSTLALHMSGGLNMQIEHHLFPSIHYTHYHAISPIVRSACEEFGLPYNTSSSLAEAMVKHYRILRTNSIPASEATPHEDRKESPRAQDHGAVPSEAGDGVRA